MSSSLDENGSYSSLNIASTAVRWLWFKPPTLTAGRGFLPSWSHFLRAEGFYDPWGLCFLWCSWPLWPLFSLSLTSAAVSDFTAWRSLSVMQFISTMSLSVPLCTGICTLDIFPGVMFIKVSLTSKPFSHWTSVSGSNNSGVSLSTGPEFAGTANNRICMVFRNNYTFPSSFWSTNVTRAWSLNEVDKVIQFCLFLSRKTLINCWHWVFASGLLILQSRIPK